MTHEQKIEILKTASLLADTVGRINHSLSTTRSQNEDLKDLIKELSSTTIELLKSVK